MDKFPKMETIEAVLYGQRVDCGPDDGVVPLSTELLKQCPEFGRLVQASLDTLEQLRPLDNRVEVIVMAVVLARIFQGGTMSERARAECEQLQDAMNPRQLTEGRQKPCDRDSCDSIT